MRDNRQLGVWHVAVLFICFGCTISSAGAQVHIREKVEIKSDTTTKPVSCSPASAVGEAIWVAPRAGVVLIEVGLAYQILSPFSPDQHFVVETPDTTYTGYMQDFASVQDGGCDGNFSNNCPPPPPPTFYSCWYWRERRAFDRALFINVGQEGDTLRFRYFGLDWNELSGIDSGSSGWTITMFKLHPCIWYVWANTHFDCHLFLSYADSEHVRFDVATIQDTLQYGDSLEFRVIAMSEFDRETPLEENPMIELHLDPPEYGQFFTQNGDTVSSALYQDVRQGRIRFVANGTPPDSLIQVTIEAMQASDTTKRGSKTLFLRPHVIKILLGETKYFRAKNHPTQTDKLTIEETAEPLIGDAIADSVWKGTPLSVIVDDGHGRRLGVYWDLKTATIRTDTLDPVMNNIPLGLIRVIGRYWVADSTYKVRLQGDHDGRTGEVIIEVKRPDRLGTTHPTVIGPTILNAIDSTWNLDSLIIEFAGKEGILPQIVKGIIRKESFDFQPSYRYEPFEDINLVQQQGGSFDSTHRYWIRSETELGNPTIPQHNNIRLATGQVIQYPGYQTVWEYYSLYDTSLYTRRVYEFLQVPWDRYFNSHLASLRRAGVTVPLARAQATALAETSHVHWLQDSINGLGMVGTIAQTRIAASYGLMQLTYYGGAVPRQSFRQWGYNYPDDDPSFLPEYINIPRIGLKYGILHFKGWLRLALGGTHFNESSWPGLEYAYWWGLKRYNGKRNYPNPVFGYANSYLPRRFD